MIGRTHLDEGRLYECYLASRDGDTIDPRTAVHLADCPACAGRYREVTTFLDAVSSEGVAATDDVFTNEKLQRQQDAILSRLEHAGRPARVISFPGHAATATPGPVSRIATRWLAAAAAAGLFVGVAVGGAFLPSRASQMRTAARVTTPAPARTMAAPVYTAVPVTTPEPIDDDRFLLELEVALQRPHTRELLSFDNLTPHVRGVNNQVR